MEQSIRSSLDGVLTVTVTPFTSADHVDAAAYGKIVRRIYDAGITATVVNGNTGEYFSLTAKERRQLIDLATEHCPSDRILFASVGGAVGEAIAEAEYALNAGAHALMIHQPVNPYVTRDGWIDYNAKIANAASNMPFIAYIRTGRIEAGDVARLAEVAPNLIGVKYSVSSTDKAAFIINNTSVPDLAWLCGSAEVDAPAYFSVGASGFTSGMANVAPEASVALYHALRSGDTDEVRRLWKIIEPFESMRRRNESANNVSVVKAALAYQSLCDGYVRAPITQLRGDELDQARAATDAILSISPTAQ